MKYPRQKGGFVFIFIHVEIGRWSIIESTQIDIGRMVKWEFEIASAFL